ncbi:phytase [Coprinopsis sp. MPI-PUGE-AT-0042]|nr:phytase [Coprinopsis sp. MPI-PUGE-AT-0042]
METPSEIQYLWGPYSPWHPAEQYSPPPEGCTINQVNIIQRHGARYPTVGANERIRNAVNKLQSASEYLDPRLSFLEHYEYTLGIADLVPFGAFQSAEAGAETFERYHNLVSLEHRGLPFVRASGSDRVIDSATNWTAGFTAASDNVFEPRLSVILSEQLNDTLQDGMCPEAGTPDEQTEIWVDIFAAPIAERLNQVAPGANLSAGDAASVIPLCAFETLAQERLSPFCALFSPEEFQEYEYLMDLEKYYNRGYGQRLGPVQGVGYINELLARLTGQPVQDNTQTNRTLDQSPRTFPLDRTIYADFSHDNLMVAVFAAMGLFKQTGHLDPEKPDSARTWIASRLVPFSSRMTVERMQCEFGAQRSTLSRVSGSLRTRGEAKGEGEMYVRVLVNDAVQPLEFCDGDSQGLCRLEAFVESQSYARNDGDGDFEMCFSG